MIVRWEDWIVEDPNVMAGKPTFRGTRLTVAHVLENLGFGMSEAELLRGHPRLTPDHIRAALLYAAAVVRMERLISIA